MSENAETLKERAWCVKSCEHTTGKRLMNTENAGKRDARRNVRG